MTTLTINVDERTEAGRLFLDYMYNVDPSALQIEMTHARKKASTERKKVKNDDKFEKRFIKALDEAFAIKKDIEENGEAALKKYMTLDEALETL